MVFKGKDSNIIGVEKEVLCKDGIVFVEYYFDFKQYLTKKTKCTKHIKKCFSIIMEQYSLPMELALEAEVSFKIIKAKLDTIKLMKTLERICNSYYQSHLYAPMGVWDVMD